MARKFVDLEEAAKMLGVSADTLNDMRDRHEIYGYRDGMNWKFKQEDVEKLIADRGAPGGSDQVVNEFAELDENTDSILLSDVELGQSPGTSSTIIGKSDEPARPDSDIKLADSKKGGSGLDLGSMESDLKLGSGTGASDLHLAGGSNVLQSGSGLSGRFDDLNALDLELPKDSGGGSSKKGSSKKSLKMSDSSDLSLEDQHLALGEEPKTAKPASDKKKEGSSKIHLASKDDDDLVLGGSSGTGSDITRSAGDSGISLLDPADSGLSLEEAPVDLGGSAAESLELGEDDMVLLEEEADTEGATQLKSASDDDFLLTPSEDAGGDESDSGSQVIALDSDVEFDDSAATMLGGGKGAPALGGFGDDLGGGLAAAGALEVDSLGTGMGLSSGLAAPAMQVTEAPYSIWNVLFLFVCTMLLIVAGMMLFDLMRNMWSWDSPYPVNTSMMDTILGWFEK